MALIPHTQKCPRLGVSKLAIVLILNVILVETNAKNVCQVRKNLKITSGFYLSMAFIGLINV